MFNDLSSPAALIATRRSGKPRDMVAPGPDATQLDRILTSAMRIPDHGKLAPWRFVVIKDRVAFGTLLEQAYCIDKPDPGRLELETVRQFAGMAPTLIAILSVPNASSHIPLWEQELSAGAACMTLLMAAHAEGFVGGWLTGWASYSEMVAARLGPPGAKIAGFLFLGSAEKPHEERPRPDFEAIVSHWTG